MFSPVGPQSPSVYWRRRLLVVGALVLLVVLVVLTVQAASGGGGGEPAAASQTTPSSAPAGTTTSHPSTPASTPVKSSSSATAKKSSSASSTASSSASVAGCRTKDLAVAAAVGKRSYNVGDEPMVEVQVTNNGSRPCVQDLADRQIVLKVYNGESRVWGSHDCEVQSGQTERTLGVKQPVRVSVRWSGFTSQPKCAGTRQRVGAGSYTLYAALAGKTGAAAQFTIG